MHLLLHFPASGEVSGPGLQKGQSFTSSFPSQPLDIPNVQTDERDWDDHDCMVKLNITVQKGLLR